MTNDITDDGYVIDEEYGTGWTLKLGDSCERLAELDSDSIDFAIYSPPFASLYTYSPSLRDLGNSGTREEFFTHYGFVIAEMLRVTRPGRINAVHVQQLATTKATHGIVGLTDFRGEVIRAYVEAGWVFHGEVTIDKDPQAQAIRTKAQALMFNQLHRDSAKTRPALADYILIFRKPGENAVPIIGDVDNDTWIQWARPTWKSTDAQALTKAAVLEAAAAMLTGTLFRSVTDAAEKAAADAGYDITRAAPMVEDGILTPARCWYGIRESNTLNVAAGRDSADERHICPLQLDLIERCVRLWSNPGETVLSPFAGIGSEGYVSIKQGRSFVGCELKPSYFRAAANNLRRAEDSAGVLTLFDLIAD